MTDLAARQIHLAPDELAFVAKAAYFFVPDYDVVIYGSRARGDHRRRSDIDIAVFGAPDPFDIDVTRFYTVLREFELTLQPKIVQMHEHKAAGFRQNVLEDGLLVYEGCGAFRAERSRVGYDSTEPPFWSVEAAARATAKTSS